MHACMEKWVETVLTTAGENPNRKSSWKSFSNEVVISLCSGGLGGILHIFGKRGEFEFGSFWDFGKSIVIIGDQ